MATWPGWLARRPGWLAWRPRWLAWRPGRGGWTDGWIHIWIDRKSPILQEKEKENQFSRGIIWSAVPLLPFILYFSCGWAVAGQQL